jgi:hypothetical protein
MKRYVALAVMALLGAPVVTSTSNAAPLGGTALSTTSATVDISAVTNVAKRRKYRQRYYRKRTTSRRIVRPRYWAYEPYSSGPLFLDSPYYYSTSPYGYPFYGRFGSPYSRWYRGGPYLGYGW